MQSFRRLKVGIINLRHFLMVCRDKERHIKPAYVHGTFLRDGIARRVVALALVQHILKPVFQFLLDTEKRVLILARIITASSGKMPFIDVSDACSAMSSA